MTFLIFMIGVSLALNVAVGIIAYLATVESRHDRLALERTRRDVAAMLVELQRIRMLASPMPISDRAPFDFRTMLGTALVRYERKAEIDALAAELVAA